MYYISPLSHNQMKSNSPLSSFYNIMQFSGVLPSTWPFLSLSPQCNGAFYWETFVIFLQIHRKSMTCRSRGCLRRKTRLLKTNARKVVLVWHIFILHRPQSKTPNEWIEKKHIQNIPKNDIRKKEITFLGAKGGFQENLNLQGIHHLLMAQSGKYSDVYSCKDLKRSAVSHADSENNRRGRKYSAVDHILKNYGWCGSFNEGGGYRGCILAWKVLGALKNKWDLAAESLPVGRLRLSHILMDVRLGNEHGEIVFEIPPRSVSFRVHLLNHIPTQ